MAHATPLHKIKAPHYMNIDHHQGYSKNYNLYHSIFSKSNGKHPFNSFITNVKCVLWLVYWMFTICPWVHAADVRKCFQTIKFERNCFWTIAGVLSAWNAELSLGQTRMPSFVLFDTVCKAICKFKRKRPRRVCKRTVLKKLTKETTNWSMSTFIGK